MDKFLFIVQMCWRYLDLLIKKFCKIMIMILFCGVLRVDDTKINAKYISFILNEAGKKQGFSRKLRASIDRIKALRVKLPSLEFQDQIADITDKIEKKINEYKIELDRLEKEKEKILQKYLFS